MSKKEFLEKVARLVLTQEGLSGFTMERLAEAAGVSRPTAYQYFGSREGALAATAASTLKVCSAFVDGALKFQGHPREQATALMTGFEMLARFEPDHLETLDSLGMPWVKNVLPPEPLTHLREIVTRFGTSLTGMLQRSQEAGDLQLPPHYTVEAAAFHTQNFYHGVFLSIIRRRLTFELFTGQHPWDIARRGLHVFWDGIGWSPASRDFDSEALHDRIMRRCYPDYWLRIKTEELRQGLDEPAVPLTGPLILRETKRRHRPEKPV